jgi:hypothetical protein
VPQTGASPTDDKNPMTSYSDDFPATIQRTAHLIRIMDQRYPGFAKTIESQDPKEISDLIKLHSAELYALDEQLSLLQ